MTESAHTPSGLRAVASLEAAKGVLAVLAATGLMSLLHKGAQLAVERFVQRLHLNPAHEYPRLLLNAAGELTPARMLLLTAGVVLYACIRFIEAYGLWFGRRWAEWFAALSGAVYLPFELYELSNGVNAAGMAILTINIGIVAYMSLLLVRGRRPQGNALAVSHPDLAEG